jgi:hypothetical protein
LGLVAIGLILLNRQGQLAQIDAQNAMIQATNAAIIALSQITPTPLPTNTPAPTKTATSMSPTSMPAPTKAPRPVSSPTAFPQTGGGGVDVWIAKSTIGAAKTGCGQRSIQVTLPLGALEVELSTIGSGKVVASATLDASTTTTSFDLSHQARANAYLLKVIDPESNSVFASVIIYFTDDCSRDVQSIEYVEAPSDLNVSVERYYSDPSLPLNWYLATWGPGPDFDTWVVQTAFQATGGNGHYIYFADGKTLSTELSTAQSPRCQPIYQSVGVTSNGVASSQAVLIMPPFPDCSSP